MAKLPFGGKELLSLSNIFHLAKRNAEPAKSFDFARRKIITDANPAKGNDDKEGEAAGEGEAEAKKTRAGQVMRKESPN